MVNAFTVWRGLVLLAGLLLTAPAPAAAPGKTEPAPKRPESAGTRPYHRLKKDMPAAEVKKHLGEPANTAPLEAPEGKAEVWTYMYETGRRVGRVRVPTHDVISVERQLGNTTLRGLAPGYVRTETVHYIREEKVEVLLFNDRLVAVKVSRQERMTK